MMNKTPWRYIEENDVSAFHGLASDEYLVTWHTLKKNPYSASLKLYTYRNYSALCGRFQNIEAEIDTHACIANGYDFSRRLTGGGAIIMGENQLGICLSTHSSVFPWTHIRELYHLFSGPIRKALEDYGIRAGFRSKNDLEVNGKKIAGLGIYISPEGGIQFHSSLLLDLDIPVMLKVLKIPVQKYEDKKMVKTIEQRMTTVRRETRQGVSMDQLKYAIRQAYAKVFNAVLNTEPFSSDEHRQIADLAHAKYRSGEWVFQNSPQQDMHGMSLKKTTAGLLRTYIALKGEIIKSVLITGDFLDLPETFSEIEAQLKWSPLDKNKITEIVLRASRSQAENKTTGAIRPEELIEAIWLAAQRAVVAQKYTYRGSCYYPKEDFRFSGVECQISNSDFGANGVIEGFESANGKLKSKTRSL